jgi:hypothetical protein
MLQLTLKMAFILRSKSHEERLDGGAIAQLCEVGRPDVSHKALGCIAATGRMESNRPIDDMAADGTRDLIMSMTTDADNGPLQQLQRTEHTECQEQCRAAASNSVCLQQEIKVLIDTKIANFSRAEMSVRSAAAKSASCRSSCTIGVH